jgi:hypothetical protein
LSLLALLPYLEVQHQLSLFVLDVERHLDKQCNQTLITEQPTDIHPALMKSELQARLELEETKVERMGTQRMSSTFQNTEYRTCTLQLNASCLLRTLQEAQKLILC